MIRQASTDDASRLAEFGRRVFAETFGPRNTPENMSAYLASAFGETKQRSEIGDPDGITLVSEDGSLNGYAQLRLTRVPKCVPDRGAIELIRFYVDASQQGRGLAHELMTATLAAAAERASSVWLGVWEHNARAIAFYSKWHFVDVGSHVFMLGADEQTDRIMWR